MGQYAPDAIIENLCRPPSPPTSIHFSIILITVTPLQEKQKFVHRAIQEQNGSKRLALIPSELFWDNKLFGCIKSTCIWL